MTTLWLTIALVGVATVAIRAAGPALLAGRELPSGAAGLLDGLAPALLAALVATQTLGDGTALVLDERAAGVSVAGLALAVRAPLLVAVVLAAAATALLRALG